MGILQVIKVDKLLMHLHQQVKSNKIRSKKK